MKLKLISWNVNGIRAGIKKGLWEKLDQLDPQILAVQETKTDSKIMTELFADNLHDNAGELFAGSNYQVAFASATMKKGYSGVATFWGDFKTDSKTDQESLSASNIKVGIGLEKFDQEGRYLEVDYNLGDDYKFTLINCYYPQGGRGQFRIDYKLEFYNEIINRITELKKNNKKVVLCGDFNTTVADIDLARPKENKNNTGCLPEEREVLDKIFEKGFVDSFRYYYPDKTDKYSYWDQITKARLRNVGWRIDMFLVDKDLLPNMVDSDILDEVEGSDHAPVTLLLEF